MTIKEFAEKLKECITTGVFENKEEFLFYLDKLVEKHTTQKHICPKCKEELHKVSCESPLIYECYCGSFWTEEYLNNSTTPKKDCAEEIGCGKYIPDICDDGDRYWDGNCGDEWGILCEDCENTTPKKKGDDFNLSKKRLQIDEYCINDYHYNEEDIKEFIRKIEEYKEHVTDRKCPNEPLEMLMDFILKKAGDDLK